MIQHPVRLSNGEELILTEFDNGVAIRYRDLPEKEPITLCEIWATGVLVPPHPHAPGDHASLTTHLEKLDDEDTELMRHIRFVEEDTELAPELTAYRDGYVCYDEAGQLLSDEIFATPAEARQVLRNYATHLVAAEPAEPPATPLPPPPGVAAAEQNETWLWSPHTAIREGNCILQVYFDIQEAELLDAAEHNHAHGELTVNPREQPALAMVQQFARELQDAYDEHGLSGHFRVAQIWRHREIKNLTAPDGLPAAEGVAETKPDLDARLERVRTVGRELLDALDKPAAEAVPPPTHNLDSQKGWPTESNVDYQVRFDEEALDRATAALQAELASRQPAAEEGGKEAAETPAFPTADQLRQRQQAYRQLQVAVARAEQDKRQQRREAWARTELPGLVRQNLQDLRTYLDREYRHASARSQLPATLFWDIVDVPEDPQRQLAETVTQELRVRGYKVTTELLSTHQRVADEDPGRTVWYTRLTIGW